MPPHGLGAQAFATDGVLIDIRKLNRVLAFDTARGLIEVESGMQWPKLLADLTSAQRGRDRQWGFSQKQTGADRLTMGGCLSANVHGRGLTLPPFVGGVESFRLPDARGELGSGWAFLVVDPSTHRLEIRSLPNQRTASCRRARPRSSAAMSGSTRTTSSTGTVVRIISPPGGTSSRGTSSTSGSATSRPELFLGALPTWSHSREWGSA
jgi:hypothetical protein